MKVAVIGGGSTGFMAAAHLTRHAPAWDLTHIYDSRIPTLGVGEGTTPHFPGWLREIAPLGLADLEREADCTVKAGGQFEGWGRAGGTFRHRFQPAGAYAYHLSATRLVEVLRRYVRARHLEANVASVASDGEATVLRLAGGHQEAYDLVFDARGFPRSLGDEHEPLPWLTMNSAVVTRGPVIADPRWTLNIARPHGWVFGVPLASSTGYGYIHDDRVSSRAEVLADFEAFLATRGRPTEEPRWLRFPAFVRRTLFDGSLFHLGNTGSFLEPLEATSLGTTIMQLRMATRWVAGGGRDRADRASSLVQLNEFIRRYILRSSLFVGWHYSQGSAYDTPFWNNARTCYHQGVAGLGDGPLAHELADVLASASCFDLTLLDGAPSREVWNQRVFPALRRITPFGNFSELSFAQVGRGIGHPGAVARAA